MLNNKSTINFEVKLNNLLFNNFDESTRTRRQNREKWLPQTEEKQKLQNNFMVIELNHGGCKYIYLIFRNVTLKFDAIVCNS